MPSSLSPFFKRVLASDTKASNAVRKERMAAQTVATIWPQLSKLLLADAA
jgi:hypothetical protein